MTLNKRYLCGSKENFYFDITFIFLKISARFAALPPLDVCQVIKILHHKATSNAGRIVMQLLCVPV